MEHLGSDSGERWPPFALIGGLLLVAAGFAVLLPETLGKELPATLAEARALRVPASRKRRSRAQRTPDSGGGDSGGASERLLAAGPSPGGTPCGLNAKVGPVQASLSMLTARQFVHPGRQRPAADLDVPRAWHS